MKCGARDEELELVCDEEQHEGGCHYDSTRELNFPPKEWRAAPSAAVAPKARSSGRQPLSAAERTPLLPGVALDPPSQAPPAATPRVATSRVRHVAIGGVTWCGAVAAQLELFDRGEIEVTCKVCRRALLAWVGEKEKAA